MLGRQWKAAVQFGGPGVLIGLALAWSMGGHRGLFAQGEPARAPDRNRPAMLAPESSGVTAIVSPPQPGSSGQLLYLIDAKERAFAVYQVDPSQGKGTIKLQGVRQFRWDLQLEEWNNHEPEVGTVKAAVKAGSSRSQ